MTIIYGNDRTRHQILELSADHGFDDRKARIESIAFQAFKDALGRMPRPESFALRQLVDLIDWRNESFQFVHETCCDFSLPESQKFATRVFCEILLEEAEQWYIGDGHSTLEPKADLKFEKI